MSLLDPLALSVCVASDLSPHLPSLSFDQLCNPQKIEFWPGIDAKQVACIQLLKSLTKKFVSNKSPDADIKALAKFREANALCNRPHGIDVTSLSELENLAINEAKGVIYHLSHGTDGLSILSLEKVLDGLATGPGASIGASGESFYHKIGAGPMSTSSRSLWSLYRRHISGYPTWDEAEKLRSNRFGEPLIATCSKLTFVPKSSEISRTICTEPLLNMMFQQGIRRQFESSLKHVVNIDLEFQQQINRRLCEIGSRTGRFGTIDLSSASDTISVSLVRELFPPAIVRWLMETRTAQTELPNKEVLDLHMVSSMGNAFTFPLQTMIFSSIVIGAYRALSIPVRHSFVIKPKGLLAQPQIVVGNWAVNGDDIIVDSRAYKLVMQLLTRFGFQPNFTKSYNEGPFRESCGADFWLGHPVRGVYCQRLDNLQDRLSLINRLNVWTVNQGIPLPATVALLSSGIRFNPIPPWESDTCGLKVPLSLLSQEFGFKTDTYGLIVYKRWVPRQRSISLLNVGARPTIGRKDLYHNPAAIVVSAVRGTLRHGNIIFRDLNGTLPYKMRKALAPSWDWLPTSQSPFTTEGWLRWNQNILIQLNLGL